jgi:hypothetical protein
MSSLASEREILPHCTEKKNETIISKLRSCRGVSVVRSKSPSDGSSASRTQIPLDPPEAVKEFRVT